MLSWLVALTPGFTVRSEARAPVFQLGLLLGTCGLLKMAIRHRCTPGFNEWAGLQGVLADLHAVSGALVEKDATGYSKLETRHGPKSG